MDSMRNGFTNQIFGGPLNSLKDEEPMGLANDNRSVMEKVLRGKL